MTAAAPSGLVTFLFTDVQGSTRRWEADADAMRAALDAHDRVLRNAIDAHGGFLFKHTGDGVCATFASLKAVVQEGPESAGATGRDRQAERRDRPGQVVRAWWHVIDANLAGPGVLDGHVRRHRHRPQADVRLVLRGGIRAKSPRSPAIRNPEIGQGYYAAAPGIARICDRVSYTHIMLVNLIDKGLLTADPEVLNGAVAVTNTGVDEACRCVFRTCSLALRACRPGQPGSRGVENTAPGFGRQAWRADPTRTATKSG